jgi:hypothetical protein
LPTAFPGQSGQSTEEALRIVPLICAAFAVLVSGCTTISTTANVTGTLLSTTASVASSAVSATAAVVGTAATVTTSKYVDKLP